MDHENVCGPVRKSEISDEQMTQQSWGTERKLTWRHRTIAKLLEDALKESAICRDCKTGDLQLLKNESSRNGQGRIWVLQFKSVDSKKNPKRFHISQKSSRFYEINRALGQSVVVILPLKSFVASLPNPVCKHPWSRHTQVISLSVVDRLIWSLRTLFQVFSSPGHCTSWSRASFLFGFARTWMENARLEDS